MRAIILLAVIAALLSYGCIAEECPPDYVPVCGEDGETYSNDCFARQAGVEVAYNGSCVACSDSEATGDIFVYGEVVYNDLTYVDSCYDSLAVVEYYCSEDELVREVKTCPEAHICSDGACVVSVSQCTDSDEGYSVYEKGTVTMDEDQNTDYCSDGDIVEYYCSDGEVKSATAPCPAGYACSDGACILSECDDSDGGLETTTAGTVTKEGISYTDYCSDSYTVIEYYCDDDNVESESLACPTGYSCNLGVCVEDTDCEDSDNGQKIYTRGTITKGATSNTDYCIDEDTVYEFYCSFNFIAADWINCPEGYRCSDGKCERYCSDTDGGENEYEQGTLQWGTSDYDDFCTSTNRVREYYCGGVGGYDYIDITCPVDFECDDGRCFYAGTDCTDSDFGIDRYDKGTTVSDSDYDIDYCFDSDTVREYYCGTGGDTFHIDLDCPEDYECDDGECIYAPTTECNDTDGGQDIYVRAALIEDGTTYTDYCYDSDSLWEYYCSAGSMQVIQRDCPTDYICTAGECVYSPTETCSDTDGGDEIYAKGTVTKGTASNTDSCYDSSTVREHYCSANNPAEHLVFCPYGYSCSDGACVYSVPECTKSDGSNVFVYGYADYNSTNYYDYCKNSTHVYEYYCGNPPYTVAQYCGWGYGCSGGVCVETCSDTDGGLDISVRGTARYGSDSSTDYCSGASSVIEYYCGITGILSTTGVCSSDYICSSGECVEECVDADGSDPYSSSYITFGGTVHNDVCLDGDTVREYTCPSNTSMSYVDVVCTGGAVNYCSGGRCIRLT